MELILNVDILIVIAFNEKEMGMKQESRPTPESINISCWGKDNTSIRP